MDDEFRGKDFLLSRDDLKPESVISDLEREASMGLNSAKWGDEDKCTHCQGNMPTQSVYLCRTCTAEFGRKVVICFGCSLECHGEHDILELWKKKDIQCCCGTGDLATCALASGVNDDGNREINTDQNFAPAHNFEGLFCWCNQPYEYEDNVLMIQCSLCTDWFHEMCIVKESNTSLNDDMIDSCAFLCRDCMTPELAFVAQKDESERNVIVCPRRKDAKELIVEERKSTFFPAGFEATVCQCDECPKLTFLELDDEEEDEEEEEENGVLLNRNIDDALQTLPHTNQFAMASGYSRFKEIATRIIAEKYNSGKRVIDEDDVEEIKRELESSKKKMKK